MQHPSQWLRGEPGVFQSLVETGDRTPVHLLVRAVSAVYPDYCSFVAVTLGVGVRSAQGFGPVGRESLAVLGMEAVAERVADDLVGHHPGVPCLGQANQPVVTAGSLVNALHGPWSTARCERRRALAAKR